MKRQALLIFTFAALVWHGGVMAQAVGRAEIQDLPQGWSQLVAYDKAGLSVNGGQSRIAIEGKAFLDSQRAMLLVIESTSSAHTGPIDWVSMKCPEKRPNYFTNDYGSSQIKRETQCLVVNSRYSSRTYLAENYPQVAVAVESAQLRFEKGQLVRTWSGVRSGSYMKVALFKNAPPQANSVPKEGGADLEAALVAFGESLHKLVYDSTSSVSGNLSLQLLNTLK